MIPTYFRYRCTLTGGYIEIALQCDPTPPGDQLALTYGIGLESGSMFLAGTQVEIAVDYATGSAVGIVYFDVSPNGVDWYPFNPSFIDTDYAVIIPLPLPSIEFEKIPLCTYHGSSTGTVKPVHP